jgi:hypothetical protein
VFDALNRPVQMVTPHSAVMSPNVIRLGYDEATLLYQMDVWLQRASAPAALLDPATADRHAVTAIDYNARHQRLSVSFGNAAVNDYGYDPRHSGWPAWPRPGRPVAAGQRGVGPELLLRSVGNVTRSSIRGRRMQSSSAISALTRPRATATTRCTG